MARKQTPFLVRFDPPLRKRLEKAAKERRMSMNQAVQQAVERWLGD